MQSLPFSSPNASVSFRGSGIVVRALTEIPKEGGEVDLANRVSISYIDPMEHSTLRRRELLKRYYFMCQCSRCCGGTGGGRRRGTKEEKIEEDLSLSKLEKGKLRQKALRKRGELAKHVGHFSLLRSRTHFPLLLRPPSLPLRSPPHSRGRGPAVQRQVRLLHGQAGLRWPSLRPGAGARVRQVRSGGRGGGAGGVR